MWLIHLLTYSPLAAGLVAAAGMWLARRRTWATLPLAQRLPAVVGAVIALAGWTVHAIWSVSPFWMPPLNEDGFLAIGFVGYGFPLVLCLVALIIAAVPVRTTEPRGDAQLEPRTWTTFAPRAWMIVLGTATSLVVALSVLAGLASSADESGRYVNFSLALSDVTSAGTSIYGWFYSIPCSVAIGAILVVVVIALFVISRRPLRVDRASDAAMRVTRARNILALASGGIVLHLSAILTSLYGTSTLRAEFDGGVNGRLRISAPFEALGPVFLVGGYLAAVAGLALWWVVVLSAVPVRASRASLPVPA